MWWAIGDKEKEAREELLKVVAIDTKLLLLPVVLQPGNAGSGGGGGESAATFDLSLYDFFDCAQH